SVIRQSLADADVVSLGESIIRRIDNYFDLRIPIARHLNAAVTRRVVYQHYPEVRIVGAEQRVKTGPEPPQAVVIKDDDVNERSRHNSGKSRWKNMPYFIRHILFSPAVQQQSLHRIYRPLPGISLNVQVAGFSDPQTQRIIAHDPEQLSGQ